MKNKTFVGSVVGRVCRITNDHIWLEFEPCGRQAQFGKDVLTGIVPLSGESYVRMSCYFRPGEMEYIFTSEVTPVNQL